MSDQSDLFGHLQSLLQQGKDPDDHDADIFERYGQTVAVMVIDSVGFSRVAERSGILYFLSRMIRVRDSIEPALHTHGASMVRFEADNAYAAFDHVDAAIEAAHAVHQQIADAGIMLSDDEPYRVCIGIGYGTLLHAGHEGYFGHEMNLASKLGEDIAEGAETLITLDAHRAASPSLTAGFTDQRVNVSGIELQYARKRH